MCIKVDADEALRAAIRPRVGSAAAGAGVEWTPAQVQDKMLFTERLEDIARASGDWLWETDDQHRYTWVHGAPHGCAPPAIGARIPAGRVVNWLGEPELPARDLHAVLRQGEPIVRLVTAEQHHGQLRFVSRCAIALLNADGSLRGHRGSARDVTDSLEAKVQLWRRDEALRLAKEQAEASSRAKSVLVSKVGHELRTPLNAIVGLAQLLQRRGAPGDKASVERWIGQIAKTGWHMVDMLDVLMELGRAGAVSEPIVSQPVDVVEVVREAMHVVEREAQERFINIAFDDQTLTWAAGDRRALRQVLVNLLSNAIKYNCERGRVHLSVTAGELTRIDVQDTGAGLSSEQIGRLYRPFERLGAERTQVPGHGLGLLICKELVASMRGTIQVQSSVGQGTTFSVFMPRAHAPLASANDGVCKEPGVPFAGCPVLVDERLRRPGAAARNG